MEFALEKYLTLLKCTHTSYSLQISHQETQPCATLLQLLTKYKC